MAIRKSKVLLNGEKLFNEVFAKVEKEQTSRLIAYAEQEIKSIGNDIASAATRNNLDRTGNLLDSLCFAVYFNGRMKRAGYYRTESSVEDSHLHEYSRPIGMSVNGHFLASQFVAGYSPKSSGWEVIFAVLAPYWGYWEKGFTHVKSGERFKWSVMTRHYDVVKNDLRPCEVKFDTYIPT